jgi:hypothetical protein
MGVLVGITDAVAAGAFRVDRAFRQTLGIKDGEFFRALDLGFEPGRYILATDRRINQPV